MTTFLLLLLILIAVGTVAVPVDRRARRQAEEELRARRAIARLAREHQTDNDEGWMR